MSPPGDSYQLPLESPGAALRRVRSRAPLVQNITNFVAMNTVANVLLAVGASPAMVHAREEAGEFARLADALTVNIGTLSPLWLDGMLVAAASAENAGKPWVLDPVAVGATTLRRDAARRLLELAPTLVRGNASEIIALAVGTGSDERGANASSGKGVDATDPVAAAELAAVALAQQQHCVVAVTGEIDFVTDGARAAHIANGHVMMPQVTALGCALTGVCGAFLGAGGDPFECTVAALAYYGLAGEHAARGADGPGSFALCFVDALCGLSADALDKDARIAPIAVPSADGADQRGKAL